MLIPIFAITLFNIASSHIKSLPMDLCAVLADENSVSHIEMIARIFAALNTVSIEVVLGQ